MAAVDDGVDVFLPFFISSIVVLYDVSDNFGSYFSNNNSNFCVISTNVGRLRESYYLYNKEWKRIVQKKKLRKSYHWNKANVIISKKSIELSIENANTYDAAVICQS